MQSAASRKGRRPTVAQRRSSRLGAEVKSMKLQAPRSYAVASDEESAIVLSSVFGQIPETSVTGGQERRIDFRRRAVRASN
jgi:hypothetical protein